MILKSVIKHKLRYQFFFFFLIELSISKLKNIQLYFVPISLQMQNAKQKLLFRTGLTVRYEFFTFLCTSKSKDLGGGKKRRERENARNSLEHFGKVV